jgi:predicted nucleic acid-binding protein
MPPKQPKRVYWDASVFLALFQKGDTPDLQYQREQSILLAQEARKGEVVLVTSTFTLAEARRGQGEPPFPGDEHATMSSFFQHSYIEAIPVDRTIAELAAEYGERFHLKPADAVQLATAARARVTVFLAWDRDFHRKNAMVGSPVPIEEPKWIDKRQTPLEAAIEARERDDEQEDQEREDEDEDESA